MWRLSIFSGEGNPGSSDLATLDYITRTFEDPLRALAPFADGEIGAGLWSLGSGGEGLHTVSDPKLPWDLRRRCIQTFVTLFRDLFQTRCTSTLSHLERPGADVPPSSQLNSACYMWWDFDCWVASRTPLAANPLDEAFLDSMQSILAIPHLACQESALHGLGHWHWAHPEAVEAAVDRYLAGSSPEPLRRYALAARCGCVQ